MDLIQSYHDQGSQSSSSEDDTRFLYENAMPSTSYAKEIPMSKTINKFEPLERIPIDRLMIATAAIAAQKPPNHKQKHTGFSIWITEIENELRTCLGSIQVLQKHTILESMDRFASKLTKDYEKIIKPNTADILAHHIRTYLHIYRYLFRSLEKGKRYYKRFIKILAIYTDLELCASIRGAEYDKSIAERIVLIYQTYLDLSDNSMVLDVLLHTKRLWRQHRGILVLLFEYFLVRKGPIELPDTLFMKNLIMFKKWLYIEEVPEERCKARDAFVRFVKPKKSICMNSLFKPYLPVDKEDFVTIDNANDILDKEYALASLIRRIKKAEVNLEVRQNNDEVIVLTDDEHDDDDDQEASSSSFSHNDDISNEFDWNSACSQQGNQSSYGQNIIETVSVDSPPPYNKKTSSSLSSLDSCDLNLDTNLEINRNGESAQHSDCETEVLQSKRESPSNSKTTIVHEINGENNRNLSSFYESEFNRLVSDINSTLISVPSIENTSAENMKPIQSRNEFVNSMGEDQSTEKTKNMEVLSEQQNGILPDLTESTCCPTNGNSLLETSNSSHDIEVASALPSIVHQNHIDAKLSDDAVKNCDNNNIVISNNSSLRNHEETLNHIEEIVTDDLNKHKNLANDCNTSNDVQIQTPAKTMDTASSPIREFIEIEMESNKENEKIETIETMTDWIPAAESTSVINEISLLTKSEQDVLFKEKDAMIFTDLLSNGPTAEETQEPEEIKTTRLSMDSPIAFLQNGIDANVKLKTYGRRGRKPIELKTISTQTSSACPSPVTTIQECNNKQIDKYLLTEKEDDELFLQDIFNTTDAQTRPGDSPRIRSPVYSSSIPASSTPIASTLCVKPTENGNIQSVVHTCGAIGPDGMVVKRKRGRPRKYPLPGEGVSPVPKPQRAPRQPKPRKVPTNNDEEVKFEKRVLRERKPKPVQPDPKEIYQTEASQKSKRSRRRNTIKMTIDAIFNTQSPKIRAIQARRISQILGIPFDSPKLATILKRRNYNKSINISGFNQTINNDSSLSENILLQSFKNRLNGQMNITNESNSQQTTPSTILARKTYIKPNINLSSFSSLSSALRRISFSARRISFNSRRLSFHSSIRPNRTNNSKKSNAQRYTKIDIFDTSKKRGRKKGSKDLVPRKKPGRKPKAKDSNVIAEVTEPIITVNDEVNLTVDLTEKTSNFAPFALNTTNEMNKNFANIHEALSSTQQKRNYLSEDTETDFTNELTTDPESTFEDADDSHTRKSKRSRKRPKILDL